MWNIMTNNLTQKSLRPLIGSSIQNSEDKIMLELDKMANVLYCNSAKHSEIQIVIYYG